MGRRAKKKRGFFGLAQYGLILVLYGLLNLLPHRVALWIGAAGGVLVYGIDRRHRLLVQSQLQMAFPSWPATKIRQVARRCYANLGMSAAEFAQLGRADRQTILNWVTIEGMEHVDRAQQQGRGVLFLTAHLGNWELLGVVYALIGRRLLPIVRPLDNPWLNRLVNRIRSRHGSEVVSKKAASAPRDIILGLRRGDNVGILLDQNMAPYDGIFVDFFGRPACTSKGLALIARRTGASVVPVFIVREPGGRHRIFFERPVELVRSQNLKQDLLTNTARCTAVIERMVRAYPDQWLWMHRRWKTQPTAVEPMKNPQPVLQAGGELS